MLSKALQDAINQQVNAEYYSAYLYLSMSAFCEEINMSGAAAWLRVQNKEETLHGDKLFRYLVDRDVPVRLQAIAQPPSDFKSLQDVFEKVLAHEKEVTKKITNLYELSVKEGDYPTQIMLQWFITEQVEEEKSAKDILDQLAMIGDNKSALLMMDRHLGARQG